MCKYGVAVTILLFQLQVNNLCSQQETIITGNSAWKVKNKIFMFLNFLNFKNLQNNFIVDTIIHFFLINHGKYMVLESIMEVLMVLNMLANLVLVSILLNWRF